jgi:hypothetical protein
MIGKVSIFSGFKRDLRSVLSSVADMRAGLEFEVKRLRNL